MNEISEIVPEAVNLATNLTNLSPGQIDKENVEGFLESLIGEYGWLYC